VTELFTLADVRFNGTRPWDIQVHDDQAYRQILYSGSLGLGDAYMDGLWDADQLDQTI
jgi:cyclopropane-fatty-acyl-phospholipid synthase